MSTVLLGEELYDQSMSDERCRELDAVVARLRLGDPTSMDRLEGLKDVEGCIAEGLRRSAAVGDWSSFERYVIAASRYPHRSMSEVLCDVLSRQLDTVNNEDIVEVLEMVADPNTVGCLENALHWEPPWDEYRQLAKKAVWALGAIGTSEAKEVLRDAASTASVEIREAAARELRRAGG